MDIGKHLKNCRLRAWLAIVWTAAVGGVAVVTGFAGCRLYEPPRYNRLTFQPNQPQTRVLMIGDSLTYYNDLPGLLQQFSAGESAPVYIEQITFPLASLTFHWDGGKAVDRIRH